MYCYLWSMNVYGTFDTEAEAVDHAVRQGAYTADVHVYRYAAVGQATPAPRPTRARSSATPPGGSMAEFLALGQ